MCLAAGICEFLSLSCLSRSPLPWKFRNYGYAGQVANALTHHWGGPFHAPRNRMAAMLMSLKSKSFDVLRRRTKGQWRPLSSTEEGLWGGRRCWLPILCHHPSRMAHALPSGLARHTTVSTPHLFLSLNAWCLLTAPLSFCPWDVFKPDKVTHAYNPNYSAG